MTDRRYRPTNRWGCKPTEDVCVAHDLPLECSHGCREAKAHKCKWKSQPGWTPAHVAEKEAKKMKSAQERIEELLDVTEGKRDLVHMSMLYECSKCGIIETMFCGYGVEGPLELRKAGTYIPSPFMGPPCVVCGADTHHIAFGRDRHFDPVRLPPGRRYYKVPDKWDKCHTQMFDSSCFCGEEAMT